MITFDEINEYKLLKDSTIKYLPKKCRCGADLVISDSIKRISCSNKKCKYGMLRRFMRFNNRMELGITEQSLVNIIEKLQLESPYQLLMIDEAYKEGFISQKEINDIELVSNKLSEIKKRKYYIYEIASMCGLSTVENLSFELFFGFNSFDEAFDEIEQGQVSFVNTRIAVDLNSAAFLTYRVFSVIDSIKEELYYAESILQVAEHKNRIRIAFDCNVTSYSELFVNNSEVIKYLNTVFRRTFVHVHCINNETDILVSNTNINSYKYRNAQKINRINIAKLINNNEITEEEEGKDREDSEPDNYKPLGHIIYIDNINNVIERLSRFLE